MVMGDQGPLCGLPWPVCPDDLGQRGPIRRPPPPGPLLFSAPPGVGRLNKLGGRPEVAVAVGHGAMELVKLVTFSQGEFDRIRPQLPIV
jgi:hypothetical protein